MSLKIVDMLIAIPAIPAIPVVATWYLPWERWIPKRISKRVLGPYLLYISFAIWHFLNAPWWVISSYAAGGIVVSAMWVSDVRKEKRLKRARDWPVVEGSALGFTEFRNDDGVAVTLIYTYKVQGERYGGRRSFAFPNEDDAALFKTRYGDRLVEVHHHPDKADVSVLFLEGTP